MFDHAKFVPVPKKALSILKVPSANMRKLSYAAYAFVTFLFRYLFEKETLNFFVEDETAAGLKMARKERMEYARTLTRSDRNSKQTKHILDLMRRSRILENREKLSKEK